MKLFGALLALASLVNCANAQFDGGFGGAPVPDAAPVKSDLPYIRCGACEILAKHAFRIVKAVNGTLKAEKRLDELVILELVERMGDPSKDEGDWIRMIDLVEEGEKLKLVEHKEMARCGDECMTIKRAVEDILSTHDTDIAEKLWQGKMSRAQFSNWLCYDLTKVCAEKPPPLPKDRKPGPAFQVDPQFAHMQKMMAGMKSQETGKGGQMGAAGDSFVDGVKEVSNKARAAAGAAVDQAKELLSGSSPDKADEDSAWDEL